MKILHLLNIADWFFMAAGLAVAILMIVMGGSEDRRRSERPSNAPEPKPQTAGRRGVRR